MFENEIEDIKENIGEVMYININTSVACTVIGYGIVKSALDETKEVLKVLLKKHEPSHYKFPWQTQLKNYTILAEGDMNPDNFVAVPYDCIRFNKDGKFASCF